MRQSDPTSAARLRKGEGEEEETKNTTIPEGTVSQWLLLIRYFDFLYCKYASYSLY